MKITFLTPRVDAEIFSGGMYCIFRHAQCLHERGHEVSVVAYPYSQKPNWIRFDGRFIVPGQPKLDFSKKRRLKRSLVRYFDYRSFHRKDEITQRALSKSFVLDAIPQSDVVIATFWETAEVAYLADKGLPAYFMQHFEPVFYTEGEIDYYRSQMSYLLPIAKIANSSWLRKRTADYLLGQGSQQEIYRADNAVDLDHFHRDDSIGKLSVGEHDVNIISYGGRGVQWKGFREMAEAVAIVRKRLPQYAVQWNVYGSAELPPDNDIATYASLGFLRPDALAKAYNVNDILLSASWYESFPLFPIEAMACGLAVVTTGPGTEDYAEDEVNCLVAEVKNPVALADVLERLVIDRALRDRLADNAVETAKKFSWEAATMKFEQLLADLVACHGNKRH